MASDVELSLVKQKFEKSSSHNFFNVVLIYSGLSYLNIFWTSFMVLESPPSFLI